MKILGELVEHKAALYEANSNTTVTINSDDEVPVLWDWPALTFDDRYYYIVPFEWSRINFLEPGVYEVSYVINSKRYSGKNQDNIQAIARVNGTDYRKNAKSYSYQRQSGEALSTNTCTFLLKIEKAGDYMELVTSRGTNSGLVKIVGGENSVTIRRLRPLIAGELIV